MERKIEGKSFGKLGYTSQGWLLSGNSGKCCNSSIRYWKLPKIQTERLVEWKAPNCLPSFYGRTGIACASPTENTIFKGGKFFTT